MSQPQVAFAIPVALRVNVAQDMGLDGRWQQTRTFRLGRFRAAAARMSAVEENSGPSSPMEEEEEAGGGLIQGPSQAPTEAGVSTAGLSGPEAALLEASYKADVKEIEQALANGADVNSADVNGRTSLHFCAGNGLQTLVRDLVSRGAVLDKQDVLGFTPLHMATGYRMVTTVRTLLELGADANIASNDGKLPVEIAEELMTRIPKKRFFMANPGYNKIKEIVDVLDDATEVEDDADSDNDSDVAPDGVGSFSGKVLGDVEEKTEKVGDTTYTVRVKPKAESAPTTQPNIKVDDVDITIRVKEPGSSNK